MSINTCNYVIIELVEIFYSLLFKLLPLYAIILLGYFLGKYFRVSKELVAKIVIYFISPVVFFNAVVATPITVGSMMLPVATFIICCSICLLFLFIAGFFWKDHTKNILAFIAPESNTGYFGLPVALLVLDKPAVELYIVAILGPLIYENTLGFFIAARGRHTYGESIIKLLKLPVVYAVALGFAVNLLGVHFSSYYGVIVGGAKAAFVFFGMMTIGLGLSGIQKFSFDGRFVGLSFFAKFIVWPILVALVLFLDSVFFHIFDATMHRALLLISFMPVAANTVAFAAILRIHPEKVAVTVVLSTIFALVWVPFMVTVFLR